MPKNFTCSFYDLRQQKYSELFETVTKLFCKQIGIILQHKNQKISYEVRTKRNHNENFQEFYVDPNYPNEEVPPLLEFLNRQNFPKHDKLRFKLLKWIVSDIKLQNYDLSAIPTNYLHDVLTLTWLTSCDFISTVEADLILLSIKHVELDLLPHNLQAPPVLHPRAFHVAFHFTKFHMALERCFEVTGLKESMTVSNEDLEFFSVLIISVTETAQL